jgi:hypothetical protein
MMDRLRLVMIACMVVVVAWLVAGALLLVAR